MDCRPGRETDRSPRSRAGGSQEDAIRSRDCFLPARPGCSCATRRSRQFRDPAWSRRCRRCSRRSRYSSRTWPWIRRGSPGRTVVKAIPFAVAEDRRVGQALTLPASITLEHDLARHRPVQLECHAAAALDPRVVREELSRVADVDDTLLGGRGVPERGERAKRNGCRRPSCALRPELESIER